MIKKSTASKDFIWAYLIHLGYNMWADSEVSEWCDHVPELTEHISAKPYLRFSEKLWDKLLLQMVKAGINMIVIDLGEGVRYDSHPEISVENSWSTTHLKEELSKIRNLGLEPIPKLNFSTCHDAWLGTYSRCVSTPSYYQVCSDLIAEVAELFNTPRFFHLGYDEESAALQKSFDYVVIRQFDLWWHDFLFFVDEVEKQGVRPWIWSDYIWNHPKEFMDKMPKSVLQSNWYYGTTFKEDEIAVQAYTELAKHGYDQIPAASNFFDPESLNFKKTVEFCEKHIPSPQLMGFIQTPWVPTLDVFSERHSQAIKLVETTIQNLRP